MSDPKRELEELRREMAKADEELLVALERRAKAARRVGELRKGSPPTLPVLDRAAQISLVERSSGALPSDALREIVREVFASTLSLELPVAVVYSGPEGGRGHVAARRRFGVGSELRAMETVSGALDEVARKRAEFAIVPYETAAEGPVHATIRALVDHELKVVEVDDVPFELHLMNRSGKVEDIAKVYVTPSDLACSEKALEVYEERLALVDVKAPALACQMAAEDATAAAVVSEGIGESYGLQVARRSIMDVPQERARFAIVGPRPSSRTGTDLTAVVFSVPDTPGALLDVLKQFAERGINLTKIQSRPVESGGWNYLFFVELVGHPTDRGVISAFEEVKRITKSLKVLGSYPAV